MTYTSEVDKTNEILEKIKAHKAELTSQLMEKGIDGHETMEMLSEKVHTRSSMPVAFIILALAFVGTGVGLILGNLNFLTVTEFWIRPIGCFVGAFICTILAIIRYCFNKKKKKRKLEAIKELKLALDKLEAAKHEELYTQRQLESKKELLKNTKLMIKQEEDRSIDSADYSNEIKDIEEQERELNEVISKARWALEQKKEQDIQCERQLDELTERLDNIKKAKIEIQAIEDAKENIEDIANEIRNSFGKRLNERASYYMSQITNGKYDNLSIDERLNILVNSKKALLPASKLSKGTVEQIYMALRLAAADIIFEKDYKPILLDDAFVMYDNKRMGNTLKFMGENMEQVILFSCHTREKVMADKLEIKHNFIKL